MAIRERVSELLDLPIRPGRWMTYCEALNREGRPDKITLIRMVMTACEELEALQGTIEPLKLRIEALEEKNVPIVTATTIPSTTLEITDPFICDICQKSFKAKIALAGHRRSHDKIA